MPVGSGGGGGDGGLLSFWAGSTWTGAMMNISGQIISNVNDPRTGQLGAKDVPNRQWVEQAIAAGALYQGLFKPSTLTPNLVTLTDSDFTAPGPGGEVSRPAGATHGVLPNTLTVWFNQGYSNLDAFPVTTPGAEDFGVYLSDGTFVDLTLASGTYQTPADMATALKGSIAGTTISDIIVENIGGETWFGIEAAFPAAAVVMHPNDGGGWPDASTGPGNTVLNSYNWVVQTVDPNKPEMAPPGIPGIPAGTVLRNSDILQWSGTLNQFEVIRGGQLTQAFADNRYWQVAGTNMRWADQEYAQGAITYHGGGWFEALREIPFGSPAPGGGNSATFWQPIGEAGGTVFFGDDHWDETDTIASNQWGMPAGTIPANTQPLDGDVYIDFTSGERVVFNVVSNPPTSSLSDTFNPSNAGGQVGNVLDLNSWPANAQPTAYNHGWAYNGNVPFTFTGGVFAGVTVQNAFYLVYHGEPSVNQGWVIVENTGAAGWQDWSVNLPNPVPVPPTITGTRTYGRSREFIVNIRNGRKGYKRGLIEHIPDRDAVYKITIQELGSAGSVYEFYYSTVSGSEPRLAPILTVESSDHHFSSIIATYDAANNRGAFGGVLAADLPDSSYKITVETETGNLAPIQPIAYGTAFSNEVTQIGVGGNFPSDSLLAFYATKAGTGAINGAPNTGNHNQILTPLSLGSSYNFSGYVQLTAPTELAVDITEPNGQGIDITGGTVIQAYRQNLVTGAITPLPFASISRSEWSSKLL